MEGCIAGKIRDLTVVRGTAPNDVAYEGGRSLTKDDDQMGRGFIRQRIRKRRAMLPGAEEALDVVPSFRSRVSDRCWRLGV